MKYMDIVTKQEQLQSDTELGMTWWNRLTKCERADWLRRADSVVPADAWSLFKKQQCRTDITKTTEGNHDNIY